ncbi:hypothetical protein HF086_000241 [Spodoptera exigua]|uniref:ATP-dependent DNA helicase n=1 Tax=Spodoptera exigua TaxID=7107 RepID=A0A922SE76_SPOEX|nr:hypothetical protein HF086_000241 [Spodoptera exigua]
MGRPTKRASRMRQRRLNETSEDHEKRLSQSRKTTAKAILNENSEKREKRLSQMRTYMKKFLDSENPKRRTYRLGLIQDRLSNETEEQRTHRLSLISDRLSNETQKQRAHRLGLIHDRLNNETEEQRTRRLGSMQDRLANETEEQRAHRFRLISDRLSNETEEQRAHRLGLIHDRLSNETPEARLNRLNTMRQTSHIRRDITNEQSFQTAINVFADVSCDVCKKNIYPQQRFNLRPNMYNTLLPEELIALDKITTCSRCNNHIESVQKTLQSALAQGSEIQLPITANNSLNTIYIESTSMLQNIDDNVPNLENVVGVNTSLTDDTMRLAAITRKTAPPLNLERERRMEELCSYFIYPDGKNGFGEERENPVTPLDYFQNRIMSNERRFNRNEYLFYALSIVEYFRAKSSVSVSCRMRQGHGEHTPQGLVDNMHLTMRNIRGSASYWQKCCSELIAMVRSLGPPTWFLTFSCNDLNWTDMIKALLIADGRDIADPEHLTFSERLLLVQRHPVVVARQFTLRVNALMQFLKRNQVCLGGPIEDFWYRVEFQNRGSPHLHITPEESMVNNYNAVLLGIWKGNIDVQPCRSVTAVAYYVAKYASKCEPHDTGDVIREAISKAKRQGGDVWKQLFSVSMAILNQRLLEDLSLAEFAVRYETVSSTIWSEDDGGAELREEDNITTVRYIKLAQVTALNAARETHVNNAPVLCAGEQIVNRDETFCEDMGERALMSDELFLSSIRGLNIQQRNLFQKVSLAIENDLHGQESQLLLFITGGAGSGKSFLLKLIVEHIKRCYAPTVDTLLKPNFVEVGSLTGVAARQIFGKTLHSIFCFQLRKEILCHTKKLPGKDLKMNGVNGVTSIG